MPIAFPNRATQSASRHPKRKSATIGGTLTEPWSMGRTRKARLFLIHLESTDFSHFSGFKPITVSTPTILHRTRLGICSDCKVPKWNGVKQKKPPFGWLFYYCCSCPAKADRNERLVLRASPCGVSVARLQSMIFHMQGREPWIETAERAANEQDPVKLLELTNEIDRLLGEKEERMLKARLPEKP
jgi:hypothetical protein